MWDGRHYRCEACGEVYSDARMTCPSCGGVCRPEEGSISRLEKAIPVNSSASVGGGSLEESVKSARAPLASFGCNSCSGKSRACYVSLGIILGFFGVHLAYARRWKLFAVFWCVFLVSFVSAAAVSKQDDRSIVAFVFVVSMFQLLTTLFVNHDGDGRLMPWPKGYEDTRLHPDRRTFGALSILTGFIGGQFVYLHKKALFLFLYSHWLFQFFGVGFFVKANVHSTFQKSVIVGIPLLGIVGLVLGSLCLALHEKTWRHFVATGRSAVLWIGWCCGVLFGCLLAMSSK